MHIGFGVSYTLVCRCASDYYTAQPDLPHTNSTLQRSTMSCITFRQTSIKQGTARPAARRTVRVTAVHQLNKPVAGFAAAAAAAVLLVS
jgi:C4-type Zn-finger protein